MVRPEVKKKQRELAAAAAQSRKAHKKLQKVVLHKKSKVDRNHLLTQLKKYQLRPDQLEQLHSTSAVQTKGLKRFLNDNDASLSHKQREIGQIKQAEQCLDASTLLRRKRQKRKKSLNEREVFSSSEDTEAVSTDTEIYYEEAPVQEQMQKQAPPEGLTLRDQNHDQIEAQLPTSDSSCLKPAKKSARAIRKPAVFVQVDRDPEIEQSRMELPIIGEEQNIMEKISHNDIIIVSGETGSGKTTQIPQFLYEAGYALNGKMIGITEPRRVAAVSMSERVAKELNLGSSEISYQIRFSGNVSADTKIKFMTDGVLLRECREDFILSKYSVIIIDEAHERSVFSDILIGLLSRIVPLRAKRNDPLKLVIMSATLRVHDFTQNSFLFKQPPPVISIDARQYPVTIHFAKSTPNNHLEAAYKKIRSIHSKMPKGGILVFVTSQMDVRVLVKKLKSKTSLFCLGLYAMMPLEKQRRVFKEPPEGTRMCVIATNVAETSITIPNIKYVVDTGLEKSKVYDLSTGVSRFVTTWTSKSSAQQRTGRAGRIGPGQCYRLYSSAVFTNDFPDYAEPRILQKPVEDVILQMKSMNIDNVVNFPFPTRPSLEALKTAEKKLILLGALDDSKLKSASFREMSKVEFSSPLTPLGTAMSSFAVSARCSKMIVLSPNDVLPHVMCLTAALTVREMFLDGNNYIETRRKWAGKGNCKLLGDYAVMIQAIISSQQGGCTSRFCAENGLRMKAMLEVDKLKNQLITEVCRSLKKSTLSGDDNIPKLTDSRSRILRQLLLSANCDHVARKVPDGALIERNEEDPNKLKKKRLKNAYECMESSDYVYISSESVLKSEHPDFVIYRELYRGEKKTYMRDIAVIESDWLPHYAHKLCNFGDAIESDNAPASYDLLTDSVICTRSTTYGPLNWPLGAVKVPMRLINSGTEIYKYFASFLLNGEVIVWFKNYRDKLLSPPSMMLKPWAKLHSRTSKILQSLIQYHIKSKADLIKVWEKDQTCKYSTVLYMYSKT